MNLKKIAGLFSALKQSRRAGVLSAVIGLSIVFCLLTSFVVLKLNFVTVSVDDQVVASFTTVESEPEKLLHSAGITLGEFDTFTLQTNEQNLNLKVRRAFTVSIHTSNEIVTVTAGYSDTVADVLESAQVSYSQDDKLSAKLQDVVTPGMEISLVRRNTKTITETEKIDFETVTKKSDALYQGVTQVSRQGIAGEKTLTYSVVYEDGKEVQRELIESEITRQPQDKIVLVGTKKRAPSYYGQKMSAEQLKGAKCITVTATAYCGTSDGGQLTALGKPTGFGIVAVDPKVIPLGTKLYITSADGSYVYGYCVAGDTGGAIKGNRVDLFLGSEAECRRFGRRSMQVYILG